VISSQSERALFRHTAVDRDLRGSRNDANLRRCVRPECGTNIDLSALVDVTSTPNSTTRTRVGVSDRCTQALASPCQTSERTSKGYWFSRND
jgi:hypothetical protein